MVFRFLFALLIFFIIAFAPLFAKPGVVIASGARLRANPSVKGAEVHQLKRGDVVEVLAESPKEETLEGRRDRWVQVAFREVKGWVFGAFVIRGDVLQYNPSTGTAAWIEYSSPGAASGPRLVVLNRRKHVAVDTTIHLPRENNYGSVFALSADERYAAVDSGTDVVGTVEVFSVRDRRRVHQATYTRHPLRWDDDRLPIHRVVYTGDGCLLWEEEIFEKGAVKKTGKKGKGEYHGLGKGKDPRCR